VTVRPGARCAFVLLLALAATAAGCGGDDEGAAPSETGKPATVKVGLIPIADTAPIFLGKQKGFFKQEKLTLKTQFAAGGAVLLPSVVRGDFDVGLSNNVSLFIAQSKKLPVKIITQGVLAGKEGYGQLLVKKGGPIKRPKDLEGGKVVAVNTLNNICDVVIRSTLEDKGVDVSGMKFQELEFPDMLEPLQKGRIDAACEVEPFVTLGEQGGARGIDSFYTDFSPDLSVATYFTTQKQLDEKRDVIDRFIRAMNKSLDYAATHEAEVRKIIPTYTEIPPKAAKAMRLPAWRSDLERGTIEQLGEATAKYGHIKEPPDLDELIYTPGGS
jgi:NitT/TauT family transport system substrate-binding protein